MRLFVWNWEPGGRVIVLARNEDEARSAVRDESDLEWGPPPAVLELAPTVYDDTVCFFNWDDL
jgi:hypothetical protein